MNDVVIMAELDWAGLYSQSQVFAKGFAVKGHRVFYINRTLQRWPRLRHLITRLMPSPSLGVTDTTFIPANITVINLWIGPPVLWLRFLNNWLIKSQMKKYHISKPFFITYVPTYNSIDLANFLQVKQTTYVCYHNFDADVVVRDLLSSEMQIIKSADLLFADSRFLIKRLLDISGGKNVYPSPPGVHFDIFKNAFRGDETISLKRICFYGGAGPHLDIELYNSLCDSFEVIFIAVVNPSIRSILDNRIIIIDPVPNNQLSDLLKSMDILTILYKRSDYIDAVLPAKFFECIATGKPLLVSGLIEAGYYSNYVYETNNNPGYTLKLIQSLPVRHDQERIEKQFQLGKESDFDIRFKFVYDKIMQSMDPDNTTPSGSKTKTKNNYL